MAKVKARAASNCPCTAGNNRYPPRVLTACMKWTSPSIMRTQVRKFTNCARYSSSVPKTPAIRKKRAETAQNGGAHNEVAPLVLSRNCVHASRSRDQRHVVILDLRQCLHVLRCRHSRKKSCRTTC